MVSLYCDLNLLTCVLNRPSVMLHLSFSACVSVSTNCRPFLSSQFLLLLFFLFAACSKNYIVYLLYEVFSSPYLSSASQLDMGCCMMGHTYLGYCILCSIIVVCSCCSHGCTATLNASIVAWAILCIIVSCSVAT